MIVVIFIFIWFRLQSAPLSDKPAGVALAAGLG
jgi:hypothetical protein